MTIFEGRTFTSVNLVRADNEVMVRFDSHSAALAKATILNGLGGTTLPVLTGERMDLLNEFADRVGGVVRSQRPSQGINLTFSECWLPVPGIEAHDFFIHGRELEMRVCCCSENRKGVVDTLQYLANRGDFIGPIRESLRGIIGPISRFFPDRKTHIPTGRELIISGGDDLYAQRGFLIIYDFDRIEHAMGALQAYAIDPAVPRALSVDEAQQLMFLVQDSARPPSGWD